MKRSSLAAEVVLRGCCAGDGLTLTAAAAAEKCLLKSRSTADCSQRSSGGGDSGSQRLELSCADQTVDSAAAAAAAPVHPSKRRELH